MFGVVDQFLNWPVEGIVCNHRFQAKMTEYREKTFSFYMNEEPIKHLER